MRCKRPKKRIVEPSKILESPTKKPPDESPIQIRVQNTETLQYLVGRFTILIEDIDRKTWFEAPSYDLVLEAIKICRLINNIKPVTKKDKYLYKIFKINDKILEEIIKPPPIDPDIIRINPPPPPPPKPWWHTKVERFDMYGVLVSTQYL
jgi:hypothetical protein